MVVEKGAWYASRSASGAPKKVNIIVECEGHKAEASVSMKTAKKVGLMP